MPHDAKPRFFLDSNGLLAERVDLGDQEIIVHYDDVPESDVTIVNGLRCATPVRAVIDMAPEISEDELERLVAECLSRSMFTPEEALARTEQPDMRGRPGAMLFRRVLLRGR
ncbi:MAG: hypothetical protein ACTHMS_20515 [Jatrophihabitans sp.]|uniref:hypothetical protein n=1 Tax=Jatrophihabitans sp. TaxID=1932789 RepID=UPI003F7FBA51